MVVGGTKEGGSRRKRRGCGWLLEACRRTQLTGVAGAPVADRNAPRAGRTAGRTKEEEDRTGYVGRGDIFHSLAAPRVRTQCQHRHVTAPVLLFRQSPPQFSGGSTAARCGGPCPIRLAPGGVTPS